MTFNDFDMENWKEIDIETDDLWIIKERDKSGKHKNVYHGNFIPQIPYQLITRYTKKGEVVADIFNGSGTTLFECERLGRRFVGFDINPQIVDYVKAQMVDSVSDFYELNVCDNTNADEFNFCMQSSLNLLKSRSIQLLLMHPPYHDIVKFTDNARDLSNLGSVNEFVERFRLSCENGLRFLDNGRYFAVVIGDIYKNSEVVPLSFLCMDMILKSFKTKLKGVIVKNIEGNRGKLGVGGIWRYRALKSDYYIFKHEYIFVFKKV